jgi:membrane protein required for colicin V production
LLFGLTFFALKWFGKFARSSIKNTLLGPIDQAGGALLGLFRVAFILSSILFGIQIMGVEINYEGTEKMIIFPLLMKLGPISMKWLSPLLPFLKKLV